MGNQTYNVEPQMIAKLVQVASIVMVYGTYNKLVFMGLYKKTANITGGHKHNKHMSVYIYIYMYMCIYAYV
jgi:hypothetical protein